MSTARRERVGHGRLGYVAALAAAALAAAGCKTQTVIDEYRAAPVVVGQQDAIVVLGRHHAIDHATEEDYIACLGERLARDAGVRVIPERTFLDTMYPWFETSTAPTDVKNLDRLLANEAVARKFAELGVRYFVWVDGSTERVDSSGSISCAVGPGGGGCFGFATWDDEARYEASIWDLERLDLAGKVSAESQGTSYLPAVIVPIPLLARVQASACESMARQLASFVTVDTGSFAHTPVPAGTPAAGGCGVAQTC